jgi:hypothetical protein
MTKSVYLTIVAIGLLCVPAFAAMIPLSTAQLAAGADVIVTGSVGSAVSSWNSDKTAIYTDYTVNISVVQKGSAGRAIVVRVPGGEVGDVGMAVEDQPVFKVGDRVKMSLVRSGNVYTLVGGVQGAVNPSDARRYYSYSGYHRSPATCNYYINSSLPSDWSTAIQAGTATWDAAGSAFRFYYQGTTSRSGGTGDGYNVVSRGNLGSGGILAQNTFWYNRRTKIVSENDIVFNTYYPWVTDGSAGSYDVQNIGTHELGHCLVLDDLYNSFQSEMTMYGYGATGETKKRTLESGDIDGIVHIYGTGFDARPAPTTPRRAIND